MGLFKGYSIKDAKISGGKGMELKAGEYVFTLDSVKAQETRNKGPAVDFVFRVHESNNPEQPVGSIANQFCLIREDWGPGRIKEVLVALFGLDGTSLTDKALVDAEDWDQNLEAVVSKPEVFVGKKLRCRAIAATAKSGNDYIRRTYLPHEEQIAAVKKALKK